MKKNNIIRYITINAIIACLYISISLLTIPISFGDNGLLDIRIAEIFMIFCFFSYKFFPGLVIGCFVSNIFSFIPIDMFVGTFQTIISCFILYILRKKPHLAIILSSLICAIIIGLEIYLLGLSIIGLFIFLSIFISEFIILEIGYFTFYRHFLHKNIIVP